MQRSELAEKELCSEGQQIPKAPPSGEDKFSHPLRYQKNEMQETHRKKCFISSAAHRMKYLIYVIPRREKLGKL